MYSSVSYGTTDTHDPHRPYWSGHRQTHADTFDQKGQVLEDLTVPEGREFLVF